MSCQKLFMRKSYINERETTKFIFVILLCLFFIVRYSAHLRLLITQAWNKQATLKRPALQFHDFLQLCLNISGLETLYTVWQQALDRAEPSTVNNSETNKELYRISATHGLCSNPSLLSFSSLRCPPGAPRVAGGCCHRARLPLRLQRHRQRLARPSTRSPAQGPLPVPILPARLAPSPRQADGFLRHAAVSEPPNVICVVGIGSLYERVKKAHVVLPQVLFLWDVTLTFIFINSTLLGPLLGRGIPKPFEGAFRRRLEPCCEYQGVIGLLDANAAGLRASTTKAEVTATAAEDMETALLATHQRQALRTRLRLGQKPRLRGTCVTQQLLQTTLVAFTAQLIESLQSLRFLVWPFQGSFHIHGDQPIGAVLSWTARVEVPFFQDLELHIVTDALPANAVSIAQGAVVPAVIVHGFVPHRMRPFVLLEANGAKNRHDGGQTGAWELFLRLQATQSNYHREGWTTFDKLSFDRSCTERPNNPRWPVPNPPPSHSHPPGPRPDPFRKGSHRNQKKRKTEVSGKGGFPWCSKVFCDLLNGFLWISTAFSSFYDGFLGFLMVFKPCQTRSWQVFFTKKSFCLRCFTLFAMTSISQSNITWFSAPRDPVSAARRAIPPRRKRQEGSNHLTVKQKPRVPF